MTVSDNTSSTLAMYKESLDDFIERAKDDSNIIAAILFGSLVTEKVWEESDIDIILISKDNTKDYDQYWLADGDIIIQVGIYSRRHFRQRVEKSLEGSLIHHILSTGKLLFSKDDSMAEYLTDLDRIGERDRQMALLLLGRYVPAELSKVRKSLYFYRNPLMALPFHLFVIERLASIEVIRHGRVPGRENLLQALECNPGFFDAAYTRILEEGPTMESMEKALKLTTDYLEKNAEQLYSPILDFIDEEGGHCGMTVLDKHFRRKLRLGEADTLIAVCECLANIDVLQRMPVEVRLTSRSRVPEMEAGYYYSKGDFQ
ncbi:MAG: nucleotidyltransferase domain-containing protein [Candidatus Thorarchaeota archaeon]|jgi:predicted nucleotidyltransferase